MLVDLTPQISKFVANTILSIIIGVICIAGFLILKKRVKKFYEPRVDGR